MGCGDKKEETRRISIKPSFRLVSDYTPHPTPYTLKKTHTLHPTPHTLHPITLIFR
ncbi:MAG: hypothetical protein F6J93_11025 [Oscillatoria sp. SIO1A7]|nr:hypothetical protein [Oscillatoria sp. SIO1A7]